MQSILRGYRLWNSLVFCWAIFSCNYIPTKAKQLRGFALGTTYNIQYVANASVDKVQTGIDSILNVINKSLSTYLPQSDISMINRGDTTVVVDYHFRAVFEKATEVWNATGGYFDPTVGALVNAYGFGPGKAINDLNPQQKDSLLKLTGWQKTKLNQDQTIKKESPNIYIDFNALAKGYAVDIIGDFLLKSGSLNFMVEIGGEIVAIGNSPKTTKPWKIAIDDPLQLEQRKFLQTISLKNEALASSGNYRKYRLDPVSGIRFVHSVNPLNGSAIKTNILSTSVKAPDCMTADAWATALMVMPLEKGKALIENDPQLEALWTVVDEGEKIKSVESQNW
ncbi:MAG: thiamine biosynthesis protein ApbE [Flavobacteriaceae bacterium]|nr:thiamine biosynthesis protein ApbE [Flavobacteriaceae bacterium]